MKASTLAAVITLGSVGASFVENDALAAEALAKLTSNVAQNGYANAEKCTLDNVAVRKEWSVQRTNHSLELNLHNSRSTLSEHQKLNYIDAVKCLGKKRAKTPAAIASGAKSRFDDFIVTHILQTTSIHGTVCQGRITTWI
jgi:tyrosinase